eukprot:TRINITY_DN16744_c0_g1_i1.p1 TRINITY_DN16744_c0_g1~~TRINITY_DN16744_c0_g1_i1.p1  ORF type:complete len:386 (+),score=37.35 TRINITY_DN16744_c0_g1_i1:116-1273(+)
MSKDVEVGFNIRRGRTVFFTGIDSESSLEERLGFFQSMGALVNYKFIKSRKGKNEEFGFVEYANRQSAVNLISTSEHPLTCSWSNSVIRSGLQNLVSHEAPSDAELANMDQRGGRFRGERGQYEQRFHLPKKWIDLDNCGKLIEGTPFVPMKVPLDSRYDVCFDDNTKKSRFELIETLDNIKNTYGRNISAIIDFTNTDRFYDKSLVTRRGITHIKISIVGHSVLPSAGDVNAFITNVDNILDANPDDLIIVHCTHGYNRTGYMICSYMCDKMKMSPADSIEAFRTHRFPGIYKACYLDALHLTYSPDALGIVSNPPRIIYPEERAADDESRSGAILHPDGTVHKKNLDAMLEQLQFIQADTEPRLLVVSNPESGANGKRLAGQP